MTILHLSSERTWRGGEQQIAYLIEELERLGVKNYVACKKGSAFEKHCIEQKIPYQSFGFKSQYDLSTSLGVKAYALKINADIVHLHSSHGHAIGVWAHLLGMKIPLVLSRRVDFPISKNFLSKFKYNYAGIEKILCVSEAIKKIISKDIQRPERCMTIHSGIDLRRFEGVEKKGGLGERFMIPEGYTIIGNTSALADHKDYFTFIDTAQKLYDQDVNAIFFIIGDGSMKKEIVEYARSKRVNGRIIFTGFVDNIPELLPELDIFLMTSKTEGLGTSILDAFACKVPVVVTDAGGISEMIEHEKTGLLAPVKDHQRLAEEAGRLIVNPDLRKRLVEGGTEKLKSFTKEKTAKRTLEIYNEIVSKRDA